MAYSRDKFRMRFYNVIVPIQKHLSLIFYTKLYEPNNEFLKINENHWKSELIGFSIPFCDDIVKENNSVKYRKNALMQEINDKELLFAPTDKPYSSARFLLLQDEHIEMSDEQWSSIIDLIKPMWEKIVDCIANSDKESLIKLFNNL